VVAKDKFFSHFIVMKFKYTLIFGLVLSGLSLSAVLNGQSLFMLHRGSDANDNVASIIEIDMSGDQIGQWTAPATGTDQYMYLSGVDDRRYMSRSQNGNLLSFNGFARLEDGENETALFAFDLNTRTFDSSTRYTGPSALRSTATVDGSEFWVAGLSNVNGIRYLEGGTSSNSVGVSNNTGARQQLLFHNNRMWVSRQSGTNGIGLLDTPPGDFPTGPPTVSIPTLTGIGWNTSSGQYGAFTFLGNDTLIVGLSNFQLQTFVQSPGAESITEDWNLLELDVIPITGEVIGISTLVDPETDEITVFYNTATQIWRTTYDPNAFDGDKFSTPELFASGLLGSGEDWGGMVAVVPEPALAWLFGLFSLTAALMWRRRGTT